MATVMTDLDLDQPTDYSLRYAEDDTDEDEKQSSHEYFPGSVQEDTVKTYCTEGTPYETPFNFSTATSMSDLRLEDSKESAVDPLKKPVKKPVLPSAPSRQKEVASNHTHLAKALSTPKESTTLLDTDCVPLADEKLASYYDSSTPDFQAFPRVNSLSSLGSTNAQQNVSETSSKASTDDVKPVPSTKIMTNVITQVSLSPEVLETPSEPDVPPEKSASRVVDKEGKMVTFGGEDFYAEQTPLMFSRSSSLGSLSGFEQLSIHDDRSSIVSDFSRRTSGIVSPSELPDSPTQTIPPSPRNRKSADFVSKIPEEAVRPSVRHLSFSKTPAVRTSVFEDDIATFKEESTPIEFSTATSLSSLTIDDDVKIPETCTSQPALESVPTNLVKEPSDTREVPKERTTFAEKACQVEVEKEQEQVSDADEGDEDDDDILAACITRGMQNNRYRQSFKTNSIPKQQLVQVDTARVRYPRNMSANRLVSRIPITTPVENSTATVKRKPPMEAVAASDTMHVYCTEDTPADISPVGSQSNLSALSMPSLQEDVIQEDKESSEIECHRNDLSDESSNLSGEDEKILDECIQSGMPKVRQITPPPVNSIPCAPKSETLTPRLNLCGTPSSSPVESGHTSKNPPLAKPVCPSGIETEPDFSDDSLNHSDDEAILTECIRSAMPKARLNISPLTGLSSQNVAKPSTSHLPKVNPGVPYFQPRYPEQNKKPTRSVVRLESNICLSEEEEQLEEDEDMLAQCIRSGIPRALNGSSVARPMLSNKKLQHSSKTRSMEAPSNTYYKNRTCSNRDVGIQVHSTIIQKPPYVERELASNFSRFPPKSSERSRCVSRNVSRTGRPSVLERSSQLSHAGACSRYSISTGEHQENLRSLSSVSSSRAHVASCASPLPNGTENYDDEETSRSNLGKRNIPPSHRYSWLSA